MDKIKEFLNKDVKEFNLKLLIILAVLFLFVVGFISYKVTVNTSYALFTDNVIGTKTITVHYEERYDNFYDMMESKANTNQTIDFEQPPSDTNGNGINILDGTENDTHPIYFYRGFDTEGKSVVTNNNVLFGGFCWRIVRTTDTGGTKLIYNGAPTNDNKCTNSSIYSLYLSSPSRFNANTNSPAYVGYMYGTVYAAHNNQTTVTGLIYGSGFTYSNGMYTLTNTSNTLDNTHHYACYDTVPTCSTMRYYYYLESTTAHYIELTGGDGVEQALAKMQTNTTDSEIKTVIDTWYENNMTDYTHMLEDTVWCNDRSMNTQTNGWKANGNLAEKLYYKAHGRNYQDYTPSVTCPNKNDAFTVSDTTKGNAKLDYPVALLTADELTMAGTGYPGYAFPTYLHGTSVHWWSMSPDYFFGDLGYGFYADGSAFLGYDFITDSIRVRPAVSLKSNTRIASGDGSPTNPYKIR